jgi:hypothetical protein
VFVEHQIKPVENKYFLSIWPLNKLKDFFLLFITDSSTFSWSRKITRSTENCYNIQEARVIERSKGRFVSPIRLKNKNILQRSPSPSSTTSALSTSTPTHISTLDRRHLQRSSRSVVNVFACDKEVRDDDENEKFHSISVVESTCYGKKSSSRSELSRTIGGYSVPYREKRNPLNSTRLSCYKPILTTTTTTADRIHLKNYKSVEDFLSMDRIESSKNVTENRGEKEEEAKLNEFESALLMKGKSRGLSSKFRSMTGKTQKLFSKFYSSSNNLKSSTEHVSSDFTLIQPKKVPSSSSGVSHSRRSLSYGTLPDLKDYEVKKIEAEDGDSGILVIESGASSMIETENEDKVTKEDECNLINNNSNDNIEEIKDKTFVQR